MGLWAETVCKFDLSTTSKNIKYAYGLCSSCECFTGCCSHTLQLQYTIFLFYVVDEFLYYMGRQQSGFLFPHSLRLSVVTFLHRGGEQFAKRVVSWCVFADCAARFQNAITVNARCLAMHIRVLCDSKQL